MALQASDDWVISLYMVLCSYTITTTTDESAMSKLADMTNNESFGGCELASSVLGDVNVLIGINGSGKTTLLNNLREQIQSNENAASVWSVGAYDLAELEEAVASAWGDIIEGDADYLEDAMALIKHAYPMVDAVVAHEHRDELNVRIDGKMRHIKFMGTGFNTLLTLIALVSFTTDGYLIVDDFGTGLHLDTTDNAGEFLVKHCRKNNTQLFVATHCPSALSSFQSNAGEYGAKLVLINVDAVHKRGHGLVDGHVIDR